MYWLDYSAAKLPGATIKAAGYGGVIRYIDSPDRLRTKHTNLAEYRDHIANGLTVRLVMQNTTTDADGGANAGVANALRAKAGADYLGYTGVIFFTNDRTTVPNPTSWQAYLDGAASVLGKARVGAYGFFNALNLAKGHASAFWQAGRKSDLVGHANFWQDNNTQVTVGGITCDRNLVIADYNPNTEVPDMDANQDQLLREIHVELTGSAAPIYPGAGYANLRAAVKGLTDSVGALTAMVNKQSGNSADAVAAALLPALGPIVKEALADVAGNDPAVFAQAVSDRLATLLKGGAQ